MRGWLDERWASALAAFAEHIETMEGADDHRSN
jgi:hypothetical protein